MLKRCPNVINNCYPLSVSLFMGALLCTSAFGRSPGDNRYFSSAVMSNHLRTGHTDFGNGRQEYATPASMISFGISAGKIYHLSDNMRLAVPLMVEYGVAHEADIDYIYLDNGSNPLVSLNTRMFSGGVQPQLQFPLRLTAKTWAFGTVGGGVHASNVYEEEWTKDTTRIMVRDNYLERSSTITWSIAAGGGIEWPLRRGRGVFVQYLFKFWQPVKRETRRDLYLLKDMPYYERFITHSFSIGYMVSRIF